jgi:dTDP-L-rhamnose 4-epimerase
MQVSSTWESEDRVFSPWGNCEMAKNALITGGAGFIGSHVADELLRHGYTVRALDNLSVQVHGEDAVRPDYLNPEVELVIGDVRDPQAVRRALKGIDVVFHFAAMVGVGQSMYEVAQYTDINNVGTAVLLQTLINQPVERLVVASSMSLYGEGLYISPTGDIHSEVERQLEQLKAGDWQVRSSDGETLSPIPTPESKPPSLASIYALSKYDQEKMCLMIGRAYGIPTVALRLFNVFGPRQSLSNPYTGVLAIFASRILNGNRPLIFEDGLQQRDFVSVYDVARACRFAIETEVASGGVFNVGSGEAYTVLEIAEKVANVLGREDLSPEITGQYRVGDIRHCFADITHAREVMGYEPCHGLGEGMVELASWLEGQIAIDRVAEARAELATRGLAI